ncbi:MAG: D-tyrosyl-tRNA(Tyr) deacylase [Planctomycetes bacterium]|nr:D-tyrosyl-tRNA(Tyr) deacylase [Planctomycetota bacterium]
MRVLLQRVTRAAVRVEDRPISDIGRGLVLFLGIETGDSEVTADAMVRKLAGLRIFDDAAGKTNLSLEDVAGEYLVVSQFTLCADLSKGKRPGFENAMRPPQSKELYDAVCRRLAQATGRPVKTGAFGAAMRVEIHNDGPATYWIEIPAART